MIVFLCQMLEGARVASVSFALASLRSINCLVAEQNISPCERSYKVAGGALSRPLSTRLDGRMRDKNTFIKNRDNRLARYDLSTQCFPLEFSPFAN